MTGATMRLAAVLTCVALATSRLGLVLHELAGHGGVALALGGSILEVKLFWFAGGWIRYRVDTGDAGWLAIAMGGIASELVVGGALVAFVRGPTLGARLVRGAGGAVIVHALWYFATGAWHGQGDGQLLYADLGDARWPVAIAGGAVACAVTFWGARYVAGAIAGTVARRWQVVAALVAAFAINLALDVGELAIRRDRQYQQTMQREDERVVQRELAAWEREELARRAAIDAAARDAEAERLAAQNRQFPFRWLLGGGLAIAFAAGAWRSRREAAAAVSARLVARAAAVAALATALVIVLDALL
jgi:hypothetical protein|nr:hypothetical protein [Kofleriaceae bacterium]